jgi:alkanesulfonate monooxygenase SsuD/methylene tetrahydromethanopterin reductase-like flavin-dependent oxidoreductase (luciferase family)
MRYSVWVSSGHSWDDILGLSRHIEASGWDGVWIPDHFMPPATGYGNEPDPGHDPELDPVHEGWTILAALAGLVPRLRLGMLVSGNTYRHPAVLAKMAATIDHVSGGRHILGLGSGWQENEHTRYGIPFPDPIELSDRLEEAADVITALFSATRSSLSGTYYQLSEAPLEPKPLQSPMPLLIGGGGERRTLRTAARYATHWNAWGTPETMAHKISVLADHCADCGRDSGGVSPSANSFLVVLDDEATGEVARAAMGDKGGLVGTPDQIRSRIDAYERAGVEELVIASFNHTPEALLDQLNHLQEIIG